MNIQIQYLLNSNLFLKKYLREHSFYYKNLLRNPRFLTNVIDLMKQEYHLTLPDKLEKIKKEKDF